MKYEVRHEVLPNSNFDGDMTGRVIVLMCLRHAEKTAGGLLSEDLRDE